MKNSLFHSVRWKIGESLITIMIRLFHRSLLTMFHFLHTVLFRANENVVNDALTCPLCLDYAAEAVEMKCYHQVYCLKCIEVCQSCPSCRVLDICHTPSLLARRMISNIPIDCPDHCGEQTTRGELEKHRKICSKKIHTCPEQECQFSGTEAEFIDHILARHRRLMLDSIPLWLRDEHVEKLTDRMIKTNERCPPHQAPEWTRSYCDHGCECPRRTCLPFVAGDESIINKTFAGGEDSCLSSRTKNRHRKTGQWNPENWAVERHRRHRKTGRWEGSS